MTHLLSVLVGLPLVSAVIIGLLPSSRPQWIRVMAATLSGLFIPLTLYLYYAYDLSKAGVQFAESANWVPYLGIHYALGVDGLSIPLLILTAIIGFCGVLATWSLEHRVKEFFIYLFVLMSGVFGFFMAQDLVMLLIFLEMAVIPKFVLIQVWGSGDRDYSALKYTLYLLAGSVFVFVAVMLLYVQAGSFDLATLSAQAFSAGFQIPLFALLLLGFGVIVPIWPLHRWTPDGHSSAPTAISMMLAGVIMKLGAYALIRVGIGVVPLGAQFWMPVIAVLATVNCVYIALVAMVQKDLKYVVANSSISHMGFVLIGMASLNAISLTGSAAQLFAHGIMAALFFALVGLLYSKTHTRIITEMSGLAHQLPRLAAFFLIAGLASLGLPGSINFISEFLIFTGSMRQFPILTTVSILAIVLTAIYVLNVFHAIFFGPRDLKWDTLSDVRGIEWVPLLILAGIILGLGIFPSYLTDLLNAGLIPLLQHLKEASCCLI